MLNLLDPVVGCTPQVEPEVERYLVIAGTSRMEAARIVTDQLTKTAFHGSVDVLVGITELEPSSMRLVENVFESFLDPRHGAVIEQADLAEHGDVSERSGHVIDE
jgi:hypothetical protein